MFTLEYRKYFNRKPLANDKSVTRTCFHTESLEAHMYSSAAATTAGVGCQVQLLQYSHCSHSPRRQRAGEKSREGEDVVVVVVAEVEVEEEASLFSSLRLLFALRCRVVMCTRVSSLMAWAKRLGGAVPVLQPP